MFDDFISGREFSLLATGIVIIIVLFVWLSISDERQWREYALKHHCVIVGKKESQIGTGVTADGKVATTVVPEQTIYRCDDGEMVIR